MQRAGGTGPAVRMPSSRHQSRACSAGGPRQSHRFAPPSAHFPALLSGSLTRLSSLSSFAISTSGPFFTSWPFFSCKESQRGRAVSREDHRDGKGSGTGMAAGLPCPSSQPSPGADPLGDVPACPHISSPRCHEMCESPHGLGKGCKEAFEWGWESIC